jgi:hypothetical protein
MPRTKATAAPAKKSTPAAKKATPASRRRTRVASGMDDEALIDAAMGGDEGDDEEGGFIDDGLTTGGKALGKQRAAAELAAALTLKKAG